jgi:Ca2+:H+ antiporter
MNLNWLLVFIPIGFILNWMGANPIIVFLASALAIVPLAGLMGDATEVMAKLSLPVSLFIEASLTSLNRH